jgi:penicillin-binding protein 1C
MSEDREFDQKPENEESQPVKPTTENGNNLSDRFRRLLDSDESITDPDYLASDSSVRIVKMGEDGQVVGKEKGEEEARKSDETPSPFYSEKTLIMDINDEVEQPLKPEEDEADLEAPLFKETRPVIIDDDFPTPPQPSKRNHQAGEMPPPPGILDSTSLPRRVDEVDKEATRVTASAYQPVPAYRNQNKKSGSARKRKPKQTASGTNDFLEKGLGCLLRALIVLLFLVILAGLAAASFGIIKYFSIAADLPDVEDLKSRASQFETTRILDRNGNLLYEILDPNAGRRTYVPLERISPYVIAATIATEDKEFYNHPGFDPFGILRAFWQNYTNQEIVSGASTITQQLARNLLMSAEERSQRTYERKAREIVLAAEITRKFTKDEIMELYVNENYYGNLAYGIEAAAETYFNTTADKLTLGQAAFLAGLPQAPSVYDIFTNREDTLHRLEQVIVLMYQYNQEKGCIEVSNNVQPVCVDSVAATEAVQQISNYPFEYRDDVMRYPHWVNYVRSLLESQFDAQTIYRSGFTVYTTLDPGLQDQAERIVAGQVAQLQDHRVSDGALVAIQPNTGEILAMVGSADFYNEAISGQVNMAISPRQPGSSIKPLTYVAAFEKGWTPSTLIWDVETSFPPSGDPNDPRGNSYTPVNYDERFHGPVTVRSALANSYNIPAVKALEFVGLYDNPATPEEEGLIAFARRLGIDTLTRDDYGLSLTLGGGDVSLLQMTSAFSTFANGGRWVPPVAITRIEDYQGNLVYQHTPSQGEQVVRVEHAYLISSILSDNTARAPMFGPNSVLNLPFQVAAKTGTTNEFRDNWTIGYTPDISVGVWVGNADYTPMVNTTGLTGAAPIWAEFMQLSIQQLTGGNASTFVRPAGVVERVICSVSGTEPSEWCPSQRSENFSYDQSPEPKSEDIWQKFEIDTWTGLKASSYCLDYREDKFALNVDDPWARKWINETSQGKQWAESVGFSSPVFYVPSRSCGPDDPKPQIIFAGLSDGQKISTSPLDIFAVVKATSDFKDFRLDWGKGENPSQWENLVKGITSQYDQPERIYTWHLDEVEAGTITLRIRMESTKGGFAEKKIRLDIQVPTPTPTPTLTPTVTPTPTETLLPTLTPTITQTPVPTATLTPSLTPSP